MRGRTHEALRRETRDLHEALDARLDLSSLASREGYIDFLLLNWACVPIEHSLERSGVSRVLPDWGQRWRRDVLLKDMESLGVHVPSHVAPEIEPDIGTLLGWCYVLEGSRLGASVILQSVMANPEWQFSHAAGFLKHGTGERLWESFKVELGKIDGDPAAIAKACTGATAAFQCFTWPQTR